MWNSKLADVIIELHVEASPFRAHVCLFACQLRVRVCSSAAENAVGVDVCAQKAGKQVQRKFVDVCRFEQVARTVNSEHQNRQCKLCEY